ncbi:MAG: tetratricopeptide repeat protein [Bdellovibrionota bacterium]
MTQEDEIHELQKELEQNPRSPQFVKLAEFYLIRDMKSEAETLVKQSLKFHPRSTSGLILLGRIFKLQNQHNNAISPLTEATKLAGENWRAWLELAEAHLELKNGKLALAAFKRVLFLNPKHTLARRAVAKLELLTADEYEAELFQMQKLQKNVSEAPDTNTPINKWSKPDKELLRAISYIDALIVRQEIEKALKLLNECSDDFGAHPEIDSRKLRLSKYQKPDYLQPKSLAQASQIKQKNINDKKISALQMLLRRIEVNKRELLST